MKELKKILNEDNKTLLIGLLSILIILWIILYLIPGETGLNGLYIVSIGNSLL